MSVHQEHELLAALERAGLTKEDAQSVIGSKGNFVAQSVIDLIRQGAAKSSVTAGQASDILGADFHPVAVTEAHFRYTFTPDAKMMMTSVPFRARELEACAGKYVLIACGALSLLDVVEIRSEVRGSSLPRSWFFSEAFAQTKCGAGWYLVQKYCSPGTKGKSWQEQKRLLADDEFVPSAAVLMQTILVHYLQTGEMLFPEEFARVSDTTAHNDNVMIGEGTTILRHTTRSIHTGLASCRKPN